jgi:hypothetical protein
MTSLQKTIRNLAWLASAGAMAICVAAHAQTGAKDGIETVLSPGMRNGCPTLQLLNVVPLEVKNDRLTLPADLNGTTRSFQFDTAAMTEQMTEAAAQRLGLHPVTPASAPRITGNFNEAFARIGGPGTGRPTQFQPLAGGSPMVAEAEIYDARGISYNGIATVADFIMKTMENKGVEFHITPFPPPDVDGVLSLGMFERFDIDLNFGARRFNLFSKDHCAGEILYWRAPGVTALPFLTKDNRIVTRVMLEGKELTAVIDTGSPVSVLRFDAAARLFGISPDDAGLTLVSDRQANSRQNLYAHDFKTLSFGTVALGNPHILLTRNNILVQGADPNPQTGSLLRNANIGSQPDMIIGMDMLKLLHLYIAMRERVLYVTQGPELAPGDAAAQPVIPVTPFRP